MKHVIPGFRLFIVIVLAFCSAAAWAGEMERFVGTYVGNAEFEENGATQRRDLSTTIEETRNGFLLKWTSVTYKSDGRAKAKSYAIEFVPSPRDGIYGSAMKTNVFGKPEPLDPLKGEPFVWTRVVGDTLSVYALHIDEIGAYEMQEYHRTLTEGGLDLVFRRVRGAEIKREIKAFLARED